MTRTLTSPLVQVALDFPTVDEALRFAEIGVRAGVDIGNVTDIRRSRFEGVLTLSHRLTYAAADDWRGRDRRSTTVALLAAERQHISRTASRFRGKASRESAQTSVPLAICGVA